MRRKFTVYGLRFSKTSFGNRINTGFPNLAVATVLTACGIETIHQLKLNRKGINMTVATVLTACGIETSVKARKIYEPFVATVLTACGIETRKTASSSSV